MAGFEDPCLSSFYFRRNHTVPYPGIYLIVRILVPLRLAKRIASLSQYIPEWANFGFKKNGNPFPGTVFVIISVTT